MIKAVIFDMDGVLVNTEPVHKKVWAQFFSEQGVSVTDEDLSGMMGVRAVETIRKFMPDKNDEEVMLLKNKRVEMQVLALEKNIQPIEGVIDFIHEIKKSGLMIAVATSAVRETTSVILSKLGIDDTIDVLVTADDVTRGKPDPEIYLKTSEKLGFKPNECIVFEDAPSGIMAAQSAGMNVIALLTTHKREELGNITHAFNNFYEIHLRQVLRDFSV